MEEKTTIEQPVQNPEPELKPKKKKNIFLIIFIILLIGGAFAGGVFFGLNRDKKKNETKVDEKEQQKEVVEEPVIEEPKEPELPVSEVQLENNILVYKSENNLCVKSNDYCSKLAFTIKSNATDAKLLTVARDNLVLYLENGKIKLYDHNTKKAKVLNLDHSHEGYEIAEVEGNVNGIIYFNEEEAEIGDIVRTNVGYYNIATGKKMYDNKYDDIQGIDNDLIQATKEGKDEEEYSDYKVFLLSANEEKVLLSEEDGMCKYYYKVETKSSYFLFRGEGCTGGSTEDIYTKDYKLLAKDLTSNDYSTHDDVIDIYDEKTIKTYDLKGNEIKSITMPKGEFLMVSHGYIFYVDENKLYATDGDKYTQELSEWKKEYYFHWMISNYYDAGDLENENEKEAGVYMIVSYDEEFDEGGAGFEIFFDVKSHKTKRYELEEIGGYAKPVLYLYPEKETEVTINFEHEDKLTTTYPKFKDEWKVTAYANGDLYDENGKYYYGLYWEEDLNHKVDFHEGFYVTKENAIEFLEEKLSLIGLNDRERNEFIMYWLPILENNGKNLVYFELTEERDSYNKLEISPKPDSILRLAIHVKKVNNKVDIKEQKLTSFNRQGFSAVEWGGVLYN